MKTQKGFTLMELLVVIGIIGILLAFVTVSFSRAQRQSRDTRRKQDLSAIQNAMEQYYSVNSFQYPVCGCTDSSATSCCTALNVATYFPNGSAPVDPLNVAPNRYVYASTATGYTVTATMELGGTKVVYSLQ